MFAIICHFILLLCSTKRKLDVWGKLGVLASKGSCGYIYERVCERTELCSKTIAFVLNHPAAMNV